MRSHSMMIFIVSSLLLLLPIQSYAESYRSPLVPVQIVIDPGHGGIDSGATYDQVEEKQINLAVSKLLYEALVKKGYRVILTREQDEALSETSPRTNIGSRHQRDLVQRGDIIRNFSPQIVLSIHVNSGSSTKRGGQVLYQSNGQGFFLAHILQNKLNKLSNTQERPMKNRNLYILNRSNTIALVIELGYLSNPEERNLLLQHDYQQKLANALVEGIEEFTLCFPLNTVR